MDGVPTTEHGEAIRAAMSANRWARVVEEAHRRAEAVAHVVAWVEAEGTSWRAARLAVAADVDWSTFRRWRLRHEELDGEPWERQLDARIPPDRRVSESIRMAAELLRTVDRSMNTETARQHALLAEGHPGAVIAQQLNAEGCRTPTGSPFRLATVRRIREHHSLHTLWERLRQAGMLTTAEMAVHLGIGLKTVGNWARAGRLRGQRCGTATKTRWLFEPLDAQPEPIRQRVAQRATMPRRNGLLSAAATGQGAV